MTDFKLLLKEMLMIFVYISMIAFMIAFICFIVLFIYVTIKEFFEGDEE